MREFVESLALLPRLDLKALTRNVMPLSQFQTAWTLIGDGESMKILLAVDESQDGING